MIRKISQGICLLLCTAVALPAQTLHKKSFMQEQSEYYSQFHFTKPEQWDSLHGTPTTLRLAEPAQTGTCTLKKRVFGWFPYWQASTYTGFKWNLLSDLCYFDYTVTPSTGANSNASFNWASDAGVTAAIANGVNTEITITLFGSHGTFFASPTAQTTCINNVVAMLNSRGGKGINVDFEQMAASDKAPFTAFIHQLKTALKAAKSTYEVSICLYAVDWGAVFDVPNLN
jgi:hypothetical protein